MGPKYFNFPWKVAQMFGDWDLFVDWYIYLMSDFVTFDLRLVKHISLSHELLWWKWLRTAPRV